MFIKAARKVKSLQIDPSLGILAKKVSTASQPVADIPPICVNMRQKWVNNLYWLGGWSLTIGGGQVTARAATGQIRTIMGSGERRVKYRPRRNTPKVPWATISKYWERRLCGSTQTRIKCWSAGEKLRAEQGPCEPSKGFVCKSKSQREPDRARESQREPERISVVCCLWLSLSLSLSLAFSLSGSLPLFLCFCLSVKHTFKVAFSSCNYVKLRQSCEMSNFLHRQKLEFKILPQIRLICDWYVFATKRVNPGQSKSLLDWFATFVVQLDIFIEFGLNVNVPGLKSPHWNIEFRIWA